MVYFESRRIVTATFKLTQDINTMTTISPVWGKVLFKKRDNNEIGVAWNTV